MTDESPGTPSPYDLGRVAASAGEPRKAPFDGRSRSATDWYRGHDAVTVAAAPPSDLVPAGTSSDPEVQFLIANRRAHEMILADPSASTDNKEHAGRSIAAIDDDLRRRGYR